MVIGNQVPREKAFAKRLDMAMSSVRQAPVGHGRQKWIRERLEQNFDVVVSKEAVRKWFAGESRPRPRIMKLLAAALSVDEAWLSLGLMPGKTEREERASSTAASGYINLVAGLLQITGSHIAFPNEGDETVDLHAIVQGKKLSLRVVGLDTLRTGEQAFVIPLKYDQSVVIGIVPTTDEFQFRFVRIPNDVIADRGKSRGGFIELEVRDDNGQISAGRDRLPVIRSLKNLSGEVGEEAATKSVEDRAALLKAMDL